MSSCVLLQARRGDVRLLGLAGALGFVCGRERDCLFGRTTERASS